MSLEYGFEIILTPDVNQALDRIRSVRNLRAYRGIEMQLICIDGSDLYDSGTSLAYELER